MCGIVGAVAERNVVPILIEGLKRLEYRGYDSSGVATLNNNQIHIVRALGKVAALTDKLETTPTTGHTGIAHTRWATHGKPSETNAHPHHSNKAIAIVHNGIIENHQSLKNQLTQHGYTCYSETDTEIIAHLIHYHYQKTQNLSQAVQESIAQLQGAYALAVMHQDHPDTLVVARYGSPLVIGIGVGEHFVGSDALSLLPVTNRFIYLEEGDIATVHRESIAIIDAQGQPTSREMTEVDQNADAASKGQYKHYMLKEIDEQPAVINETLESALDHEGFVAPHAFGHGAQALLEQVEHIHIIACGTSYHAGLVARYWIESMTSLTAHVEVASEARYRKRNIPPNTLFLSISQSGETADTLAALKQAKNLGYLGSMTICNVPGSSLARESDCMFLTRAGSELGVASTKAFTTQLVGLYLLICLILQLKGAPPQTVKNLIEDLTHMPSMIQTILNQKDDIIAMADMIAEKQHALFLGRGTSFPIALEGALKLKEISYIHAEAYPGGELKHGPLALVDHEMPIIITLPNDGLVDKMTANIEEVIARGGQCFIFTAAKGLSKLTENVLMIPDCADMVAPILFTVPLQLLAYHVAVIRGTDVDQPRNLAKSVTVE